MDVWWTLATESGEPSSRTDKQLSLDGADDLIDALHLLECKKPEGCGR
jgi:hypothetical protein